MKKVLAVYELDQEYGKQLTEYLNQSTEIPFYMIYFTNKEILIKYAKKQKISVLLINQQAMCEEIQSLNIEKVLFLSDAEEMTQKDNHNVIYKYQSTEHVVRELMDCYEAFEDYRTDNFSIKKGISVIGVYSPVKRCMKTSFCLALGQIMAQKEDVLFISMEEFSGLENVIDKQCFHDLADAVFYSSQHNLKGKFTELIQTYQDMDYIAPIRYPSDKKEIETEELLEFIKQIAECGKYDSLLIDVADGLNSLEEILTICSKIYMPVLEDPYSKGKIEEFETFMNITGKNDILKKVEKLHLPQPQPGNLSARQYSEQLIWGEMGDYIRKNVG